MPLICGVGILFFLTWFFVGRRDGQKIKDMGIHIGIINFLKTVLVAVLVYTGFYFVIHFCEYMFNIDARFTFVAIRVTNKHYLAYKKILQNIREKRAGMTTIVVASRVSTVSHFSRIIVLSEGRVEAFDTPENLLKISPTYQKMVYLQELEKEVEGGDQNG